MYIAMNRFKVSKGSEDKFAEVWRTRDRRLAEVPGFVEFRLLQGPQQEDHTLFASHTIWRTEEDFLNWTRSQHFRDAHRNAGDNRLLYLGHPQFEGFDVIMQE